MIDIPDRPFPVMALMKVNAEFYKVWRNMSGNFLVDDTFVASLLEYVHAKKHEDRNVMKALAQIDGFISN